MDKKQKIIIGIFAAVVVAGCIALVVFIMDQKKSAPAQDNSQVNEQEVSYPDDPELKSQLQALDEIRKTQIQNSTETQPKTEEEKQVVVQQQIQQLDDIRSAQKAPEPTPKQVEDQLKELDALRNAAK